MVKNTITDRANDWHLFEVTLTNERHIFPLIGRSANSRVLLSFKPD